MGCNQSRNRRKRGRRKRRTPRTRTSDSVQPSSQNFGGEASPEYKVREFEEEQKVVVNEEANPATKYPMGLQDRENMVLGSANNPTAVHEMDYPQQETYGGPPHPTAGTTEIPVAHEDNIVQYNGGQNIPESSQQFDNPAHNASPPLPKHQSSNGAVANESLLVYEEPSSDQKAFEVPMAYDDRANGIPREVTEISAASVDRNNVMKPSDMGENSQYAQTHQRVDNIPRRELEAVTDQVDVEQITGGPNEAMNHKVPMTGEIEYVKQEEERPQDQPPQRDDTYAPVETSEVHTQKPLESVKSKPSTTNDIGSICFDASTGEYKYYQNGVHIGNVDKEDAESLSKNWPVCPGTGTKSVAQGRLLKSSPLSQRNGGNRETYVSSARPYDSIAPPVQVYEGQPPVEVYEGQPPVEVYQSEPIVYQPAVGYQGEDIQYSNRVYTEEIPVQHNPGYRGYYM